MERDYIFAAIRRCNRNLLLVNGLVLLFILFIGYSANWSIRDYPPLILITALVLWNLAKVVKRQMNHGSHPIYKKIHNYGMPQQVVSEINQELSTNDIFHVNSITISPSWLLNERLFSLDIARLSEIIWAYNIKTDYFLRGGFIRIKHDEIMEVCVNLIDGKKIKISGGKLANKILNEITSKVPWITVGYSDELRMLWARNRDIFIAAVKQKKENIRHNANGPV